MSPPSLEDKRHSDDFNIPWCKSILNDPSYTQISHPNRIQPSDSSTQSSLFSRTLQTDSTIRAYAALYKNVIDQPEHLPEAGEVRMLLSLGTALNGHADVLHGGIIATIVDELTGLLVYKTYRSREIFTVSLTTAFKKPIRTPNVIFGRAWMERAPERRKVWINCTLEDEAGIVHATGEVLYIKPADEAKI